ncbi:amino acid adenylation domain-containing protein [Chitiniphilus purpureus]|uniref:Amino acid adenylation domain-containing protein n=1 Tax=Chitiniphilus purpureus TaxID=2981137 RepID=A0ABY6DME5_9NEIS|nr:non-ribosomal peptide synthetase [Chitiniphilus sp. CD1]UXY15522.1 amino acid adenylation domain-containing protein [Chitiniphilus sp. CD1]
MTAYPAARRFPAHFVAHLRTLAAERPDDTALVAVAERDGEPVDRVISYRMLDLRVRALAATLQRRFSCGERLLILLDNDDHHVVSFFACLYAGMVAVPVALPESSRPAHQARLLGIAADAGAAGVLTLAALHSPISAVLPRLAVVAVDESDESGADDWVAHTPQGGDIAFLQYTSGSTSAPKGVMVSHDNLMANARAIEAGLVVGADDAFVSWLPLFHDMGLIGGMLQPIHRGIKLVLMTPRFFLERPVRWLQAIARHRGSISGGPDFAYRLCLERVTDEQLAQLDLSSWRIAFSGAEPVRHDTLAGFAARFAPAGFDAGALYPCYGLAEATLFVTGSTRGAGMTTQRFSTAALAQGRAEATPDGAALVGCGRPPSGHAVRIVDPVAPPVPLAEGRVGEIWASGPSIASGYWGKPDATHAAFVGHDGVTWLRTGDLGFVHADQLYIAGRVKDLIIVRGHNLYPQDIERAIEAEVEAVRKGRVAAFSVAGPGGEGIGVAAELSRGMQKLIRPEALVQVLSATVSELCGEPLSVVVLLNPGALPKTSSGKLQRNACRDGWQARTLDAWAIHEFGRLVSGGAQAPAEAPVAPLTAAQARLAALWRAVLRLDDTVPLAQDAHFFALGGNSLSMVQLAARIGEQWGMTPSLQLLFDHPRLDRMAQALPPPGERDAAAVPGRIPRLPEAGRTGPQPLSHAQARQWFLWQLDPTGCAYHAAVALRLTGVLQADALQGALADLVARHDALRTVFRSTGEAVVAQWIEPACAPQLVHTDLRSLTPAEREAQLAQQAARCHAQPFDLAHGPLWRVELARLADAEQVLIVVAHHIVSDGVSIQVLIDELATCYLARLAGAPAVPLAPLPVQYLDYAAWQRERLAAGERDRQLAWWRAQLGDEQPVLTLPTDAPRRAEAGYRAAHHALELPADLLAGLRQVAAAQRATLFMVLLTGYQVLLHRHTGQADIRVGVPVANRHQMDTEGVLGCFVNTQVLRAVLDGRTSLAQALDDTRRVALGAQAHQDLPFEVLVEALQPERSLAHNPLFQVMFNYLRHDYGALDRLPGLAVAEYPLPEPSAQFELTMQVCERSDGSVSIRLVYAQELFAASTMARLGRHYLRVLQALVEDTAQPLGAVALLDEAEQATLRHWGSNAQDYGAPLPVQRLFEQQAQTRPQATALLFGDTTLSYGELNARANRLAHRLIALGVGPEVRVGIALERSVTLVVSLLAVLKAGGAYVPLDPDYPAERLAYMAADSGIALLLTGPGLAGRVVPPAGVPVFEVDGLDLAGEPEYEPVVALHAEHLAYVIHTSGSTGRPKGAANRHGALYNRLAWMQAAYRLDTGDTVLQKTPFGFDVSVWEFLWPLTTGARLLLAGPGEHRDPGRLAALIRQHGVSTLHFVPAMLQAFLAHGDSAGCDSVRRVICSGEALPPQAQQAVFERLPQAALYNLYGPTEAAIDVTHWQCRRDGGPTVPIGRPIGNVTVRVLDTDLNLAPQGAAGELYLGGAGLGRGYLGRAGLTAERFVADPFDGNGGRLYRTGDLVRWNSEGQLEYLGRIDHQVKIRGLRIELGEVEAQLLAQPGVREAVVVAREGPGGPGLAAYVCPAGLDVAQLKAALGTVLPDYMVPGTLTLLEALPLNANGKVDRKALPAPQGVARGDYAAPQGEVEVLLAGIWAEVLGLERVGRHDHFFELGGHSLHLIRVHQLLQARLQRGIALVDLFKYPSVAALASWIGSGIPAAGPDPSTGHDAAHAQRRRAALRRRAEERAE